jgi:hypothetical protein
MCNAKKMTMLSGRQTTRPQAEAGTPEGKDSVELVVKKGRNQKKDESKQQQQQQPF